MDGRGLAVGARDRRELQLAGRMVEELGRDVGQRRARVRHDRDGHANVDRVLCDDGHRAARDGVLGEDVSIAMKARDRHEQGCLFSLARVVRDLADVDGRGPFGNRDLRRLKEGAELQPRILPTRRSAAVYAGSATAYARYASSFGTASCAPTNRRGAPPNPFLKRYGPCIGSSFRLWSTGTPPKSNRRAPPLRASMMHRQRSAYAA